MKISFIGFGNMAQALAQGMCHNKTLQLSAAAPSLAIGVTPEGILTHGDNAQVTKESDLLILAVKPAKILAVLAEIKPYLATHTVVLSLAAGIYLHQLEEALSKKQAIVRCMPNTPISVGKGATAFIGNTMVSERHKQQLNKLFQPFSLTAWLEKEEEMNAITALSGSGPAYVFLFIEALTHAAEELGLDRQLAEIFTRETMQGALSLLNASGLSPQHLREKVTSPAGTTAAALGILQQQGFEALISKALTAAYQRAEELSNESQLR